MDLEPLGLFLLPLTIWMVFKAPDKLPLMLLFFCGFSGSAILNLSAFTFGVQPYHLFTAACWLAFALGLISIRTSIASLRLTGFSAAFFTAVVLSVAMAELRGDGQFSMFTQTGLVSVGLLSALFIATSISSELDLRKAMLAIIAGATFIHIWGLLQFVTSVAGLPYPVWLFNNSMSDSADLFDQQLLGGAITRISSVAIEPSFYARATVPILALSLSFTASEEPRLRRFGLISSGLAIFTLAISTATSAYFGLIILLTLRFAERPAGVVMLGVAGLAVLVGSLVVAPQLIDAIMSMTVNKASTGSFEERTASILKAFQTLERNPIVGAGWNELASWDLVGALVHHTGLTGALAFFCLLAHALFGKRPASPSSQAELDRALRTGLIVAIAIDASSGFSYVAGTLWVLIGLAVASRALSEMSPQTGARVAQPDLEQMS